VSTSGSEWSEFSRVRARHKDARPSSLCTAVVCTPEAAASFLAGTYGSLTKATQSSTPTIAFRRRRVGNKLQTISGAR